MLLAKVKNHATEQRGLVLSTGRSDYIYAGTQVLLNTLPLLSNPPASLYLYPLLCLSSPVVPRSSPGTNGYLLYNSLSMFVSCSCLSLTACKTKGENVPFLYSQIAPPEHKGLLNGDVKC